VNNSPSSATAGPNLLRRPVTSIVACMRMVISSGSGVGAPAEAASLACGGTGLAGIGQLADIAIVQGPLRWARRSAHSRDRSRDRQTGLPGRRPFRHGCGANFVVTAAAACARAQVASGPFPAPRSLPPAPGRLGGELGAGSDVKLGEHVREMGLHRPA
jgi:hypothetical protein